ncbi:hypothetical protein [Nocardiopsis halophila]|uniref:hypothetical protein n=1 Tax=Nocardiopsis halophila TaxID=141692 RepID=UPI00034D81C2|nr:hypothetical protein [Nocardiopsis halophila]
MPKKNKKKRRGPRPQQRTRTAPRPAGPVVIDLPRGGEALIRLEIDPAAAPEERELAERYWTPGPGGGWAEPVAELGAVSRVGADVKKVSTAYLLHRTCATCQTPLEVANRSGAAVLAGDDLRRYDKVKRLCSPCQRAHEEEQAERHRLAREQERAAEEKRRQALKEFLELGTFPSEAEGLSETELRRVRRMCGLRADDDEERIDVQAACLLYAMVEHARTGRPIPAQETLTSGWMHPSADEWALMVRLFRRAWIRVHPSADEGITVKEDGGISFDPHKVPFRLATSPASTWADLSAVLLAHSTGENLGLIEGEIRTMEAFSLHTYLHRQLVLDYKYPPVSEARITELYEHLHRGLDHFTYLQMLCLCWRAAATAAAWKERNGRTDAQASSATVTTLGGKIDHTLETRSPLPEYVLPKDHPEPPVLKPARALLAKLEERVAAREGCVLHDLHPIPCGPCLGMLYEGGDSAQEIREHFASLGEDAVRLRPDLATKAHTFA